MNPIQIALFGGMMGMFGFGISDFFAKKTIDRIGAFRCLFYSQIIGAGFASVYLAHDSSLPVLSVLTISCILLLGAFLAIGYLALFKAFEAGKASIVSPIVSSFAIISAGVSFFFFGESFSRIKILALGLVIFGIVLASLDIRDLRNGYSTAVLSKGVTQALVAALVFGIFFPFWDRFVEGEGWAVWIILERGIIATVLLVYSTLTGKEANLPRQRPIILGLFLIALFDAVAIFGSTWALNASVDTTSIVAAVSSAHPLVTSSLAFALLKERLLVNQYIGIVVIISGLVCFPFV
jgi:drug/metabolite transporter (DMT)-like permease